MLSGNNLFKQNKIGDIVRITTDDIPEGDLNKYDLDYPDGKYLGDIITRYSADEIPCHKRLNGQTIYSYDNLDFYAFCLENKDKAQTDTDYEYYNKTEAEYTDFYENNTWADTDEHYCPYFVTGTEEITVYEVTYNDLIGYTPIEGTTSIENEVIFADKDLTTIQDLIHEWQYTGNTDTGTIGYIHLPTIPNISAGNTKTFYFVVTNSRVTDTSTSIRNIQIGNVEALTPDKLPYVRNVGTVQNLILDFGIPSGLTPTVEVGTVQVGETVDISAVPTETGVKLNFVMQRGEKGDAGGVLVLNYISETPPVSAQINEYFYNLTDNKIYIYNDGWNYYSTADKGIIYLYYNTVYYFTGETIQPTYATVQLDNTTIVSSSGALQVNGMKTKSGQIVFDWIGTLAEWEQGRANGEILDSYICFVTDD